MHEASMITWTPTAAEEVIIQTGTGGLKVDRLEPVGTLRFRVKREPDPATQRTIIDVVLRCTKATGIVFSVLRFKGGTKAVTEPGAMRDPEADGAATIANVYRDGTVRWCDLRHAKKGPCCGRVIDWVGVFTDEYGEPQDYAEHSWSTEGAGLGLRGAPCGGERT
jgi:hypothetical protein